MAGRLRREGLVAVFSMKMRVHVVARLAKVSMRVLLSSENSLDPASDFTKDVLHLDDVACLARD